MKRIREILLTQYIGAIVIGMLLTQAVLGIVSVLAEPVVWYQQAAGSHSVMEPTVTRFPWFQLLPIGIRIALYVVVSYLLLIWLYRTEDALEGQNQPEDARESEVE